MPNFQPTVVIGIGGTGKNILLSLKKMIVENSPNGMADFPVLKLFSVDTDVRVDSVKSELQTITEELKLDPNTEMFRLGGEGIASTLDLDSFPEIKGWFPYSKRYQLNPNMLSGGASQMKPVGRFSFAWNAEALRNHIHRLLSDTVTSGKAKEYGIGENNLEQFTNVFICGSLAGGTGSGTFLDMAYLVRFVAAQLGIVVKIYGMMAMASIFDSIGGDIKLKPNCYASLVELDHFMNEENFSNDHRRFFPAYRNINSSVWDYRNAANNAPFDYPYIFDKTNESGLGFGSPKEFADMVARFVYLLTGSEVADKWQSMNNNVDPAVNKNEILMNKPIKYRSMGAFALLYPRRKITQTCAFKLASEYLKVILDSSYQQTPEIDNLVERFLNDSKSNPDNGLLEESFDLFRASADDPAAGSFSTFVSDSTDSKISECEDADKKDVEDLVRRFKEDMEKEFVKFRAQNASRARVVREAFVRDLDSRLAAFVDLNLSEDTENPLPDGGKRMVRGSIVRSGDFLKSLYQKFLDAAEKYRKEEEDSREQIKSLESDYETKMGDLKDAVDSFNPFAKGKIKECSESVLDTCRDYLLTRKRNLVATWIRQLLNEITENNIHIADGILKAIEEKNLNIRNGISKLKKIQTVVDDYIYKNKSGNSTDFCDVIFNYKTDVEDMFEKVTSENGIDLIYENLSKALKSSEGYGNTYEKLGSALAEQRILAVLLRNTEIPFFVPVSEVNIADRLINLEDKKSNLLSGTYTSNAKVYVRLNGQEMSKANLSVNGREFFAITIPNEVEYDKFCKQLVKRTPGVNHVCPFEEGGELADSEERCPKEGKCLKANILRGSSTDVTLIPSDNKSEINILKTTAGFPLRAVTSVSGPYREEYLKQVRMNQKENEAEGRLNEEVLHMFGPVKFSDLSVPAEKKKVVEDRFKESLLLAYAFNRLSIEKLAVKFISQRALMAGKDDYDCMLGSSFKEVVELSQSTMFEDTEKVREVTESIAADLKTFNSPEEMEKLFELLKTAYDRLSSDLPSGMTDADVDILDKIAEEHCGKHVKKENFFDPTKNRFMNNESAAPACPPAQPAPVAAPSQVPPPVSAQQSSYTLSVNGATYGPYTVDMLKGWIPTGQFSAQSLVWKEGMAEWLPASKVPELAALFAPPPASGMPPVPPAPPAPPAM